MISKNHTHWPLNSLWVCVKVMWAPTVCTTFEQILKFATCPDTVDRPVSTIIYFLLPSGSVSGLHRVSPGSIPAEQSYLCQTEGRSQSELAGRGQRVVATARKEDVDVCTECVNLFVFKVDLSALVQMPSAEGWHFYMGEPLTVSLS